MNGRMDAERVCEVYSTGRGEGGLENTTGAEREGWSEIMILNGVRRCGRRWGPM